jgi:hypothetical protein
VTINPNGVFEMTSGTVLGNGEISIKGALVWSSGSLFPGGKLSIANGATATLNSPES